MSSISKNVIKFMIFMILTYILMLWIMVIHNLYIVVIVRLEYKSIIFFKAVPYYWRLFPVLPCSKQYSLEIAAYPIRRQQGPVDSGL